MVRRSISAALIVAVLFIPQQLTAKSNWMSETDLRAVFEGQILAGHYANGDQFTESYHHDGSLTYQDIHRQNTGRWSITSGTFCTIYDTDPTGGCFNVSSDGSNCFEFYFIARTRRQAATPEDRTKPSWTARAWRENEPSTCQDDTTV